MASPSKRSSKNERADLIRSITTPLGFYVLALLIVEATLGILTYSKLTEDHVWEGFIGMLVAFVLIVFIVTLFVMFSPKKLLFGKEEHANPALEPSALKDQIEDLIAKNVKEECLKPSQK